MVKLDQIASLAGRMLRNLSNQARRRVAQSDVFMQRAKAEAATRRGMMDAALRERRSRRGKSS